MPLQPQFVVEHDPAAILVDIAARLSGNTQRDPCAWMSLFVATTPESPVTVSEDGAIRYLGRTCCWAHLRPFLEDPTHVRPGLQTSCTTCARAFRVILANVEDDWTSRP